MNERIESVVLAGSGGDVFPADVIRIAPPFPIGIDLDQGSL